MKMLILRGISGFYAGKNWPRGALYEQPALDYASRRGFEGQVLDISGEAYKGSPQAKLALAEYRCDTTITALYGFSGGGYNLYHVIQGMTKDERDRRHPIAGTTSDRACSDALEHMDAAHPGSRAAGIYRAWNRSRSITSAQLLGSGALHDPPE